MRASRLHLLLALLALPACGTPNRPAAELDQGNFMTGGYRRLWVGEGDAWFGSWVVEEPDHILRLDPEWNTVCDIQVAYPEYVEVSSSGRFAGVIKHGLQVHDFLSGEQIASRELRPGESLFGRLTSDRDEEFWIVCERTDITGYFFDTLDVAWRVEVSNRQTVYRELDRKTNSLVLAGGNQLQILNLQSLTVGPLLQLPFEKVASLAAGGGFAYLGSKDGVLVAYDIEGLTDGWTGRFEPTEIVNVGLSRSGSLLAVACERFGGPRQVVRVSVHRPGPDGPTELARTVMQLDDKIQDIAVLEKPGMVVIGAGGLHRWAYQPR